MFLIIDTRGRQMVAPRAYTHVDWKTWNNFECLYSFWACTHRTICLRLERCARISRLELNVERERERESFAVSSRRTRTRLELGRIIRVSLVWEEYEDEMELDRKRRWSEKESANRNSKWVEMVWGVRERDWDRGKL